MADLFLNFKDFHHEHSDDKQTTLRHKKLGHKLVLAHNVLSPKNKEALVALGKAAKDSATPDQAAEAKDQDSGYGKVIKMADGNIVPSEGEQSNAVAQSKQKTKLHDVGTAASGGNGPDKPATSLSDAWNKLTHPMAEGGKIKQYAFGDQVAPPYLAKDAPEDQGGEPLSDDPNNSHTDIPAEIGHAIGKYGIGPVVGAIKAIGGEGKRAFEGVKEAGHLAGDVASKTGQGMMQGTSEATGIDLSGKDEEQSAPPQVPNPNTPPPASAQQMMAPPTPAPVIAQSADPMTQAQNAMMRGVQQKEAGIWQEEQAKEAVGAGQQQALQKTIDEKQHAMDTFQQHYNDLEQERQAHMADIKNGYIDPNKYWTGGPNGEGGHSKVAAGIGMILAGFNPTNSPNAAMEYLKFQMNNNLKAQEMNLSAKNNLLSANLQQFHNLKDAADMTRIMQNDTMVDELQNASAKAATPMAKAAALQAAGQLKMETAPLMMQFAARRAMAQMASAGTPQSEAAFKQATMMMRASGNPEMAQQAKDMESKHVEGVPGLANREIPEKDRELFNSHKSLDNMFQRVEDFKSTHSKMSPKDQAAAHSLMNELGNQIRISGGMGVFKESEAQNIADMIGKNPLGMMASFNTDPKIKEIRALKQMDYENRLKAYGLQAPRSQTEQPQIKTVNGVKYMRGPNGEAIRVK